MLKISAHSNTIYCLYHAVINLNLTAVTSLLTKGINPNISIRNGLSLLHIAAYYGNTAIAELLIEAGAALDATNSGGLTPLYYAALYNRLETSALLLAHYAAAAAHADTAQLLRNHLAPADLADAVTHAIEAPALARRRDVCIAWLMVCE
jgi:ankyrin repeat protein